MYFFFFYGQCFLKSCLRKIVYYSCEDILLWFFLEALQFWFPPPALLSYGWQELYVLSV